LRDERGMTRCLNSKQADHFGMERLAPGDFIVYRRLTMNLPKAQAEIYAGWFRCLADPTRIEILNLLARERRPLSVGEIVERVDVGQSTVSEHLRRLAETCFVFVEHRGTSSYFRINESCIDSFPSAAEFVMGSVAEDRLPTPRPGATSRRRRGERRSGHAPPLGRHGDDGSRQVDASAKRAATP
jgi:DNA-binding transcriptional ArsR family regulator